MRRHRHAHARALAAAIAAALLAACERTPPPSPDAVARIGEVEIRYPEFRAYVARVVGDSEGLLASDVLSELFDQFLDERLLDRLASASLGEAPGHDGAAGEPRGVDALLEREVPPPTDAEIAAYHRQHAAEFARPERVRLRQILVETRAEAERALGELAGGLDFPAVARKRSRDPSAELGGDQGELGKGDLPPAFAEAIFRLAPGEVSEIVPADYGFHIFQVVERLPAETEPLERVRGDIARKLRGERADRRLRELVKEARGRYNPEIYAHNLPFEYRGAYRPSSPSRH